MRNNSEIIDYMNKIREQKHMSISELARKTNVAKSSVSLYFTNKPNIDSYQEEAPTNLPNPDCFFLQCKDDSMEPTIPNHALVLVNPQNSVEHGEIAAVLIAGDKKPKLKRIKYQNNLVFLISDNRAYEPIVLSKDLPGKIIGKAIRVNINL